MKKFTANYTYTNHNFTIQGLPNQKASDDRYYSAICVIKNIIQRGRPTTMSQYLQEELGSIHLSEDFAKPFALISYDNPPVWNHTIKGDEENDDFPARIFFEENLAHDFPEYPFLNRLLVPEYPINSITQKNDTKFNHQDVDFFLPCANLVIEIDGQQHKKESDSISDKFRDTHLAKHNILTVRIDTNDLRHKNEKYFKQIT